MPSPTLTFSFIIATLLGAAFHLIMGGDVRRLALFLLSAWIGFAIGHILGVILEFNLFNIGTLRITAAAFGTLIALIAAHILTMNQPRKQSSR